MKSGRVYSEKTASNAHKTAPKITVFVMAVCSLRLMGLSALRGGSTCDHGFPDRQVHQRG